MPGVCRCGCGEAVSPTASWRVGHDRRWKEQWFARLIGDRSLAEFADAVEGRSA